MDKYKKTEDLVDLYRNIKDFIKNDLGFNMWRISLTPENIEGNNSMGQLSVCDYNHMIAKIKVNGKYFITELNKDFEEIFQTILHEILHIFCGAGSGYMEEYKNSLEISLSGSAYDSMWNHILVYEEMMTTTLTLKLMLKYNETKEYKAFEEIYKKTINEK